MSIEKPILNNKYQEIVSELLKQIKRVNGADPQQRDLVKDPLQFLHIALYEYTLLHIGDLIDEMDNANVATLTKGLLEIRRLTDNNELTEENLVKCLIYYHEQDKLSRRKYRSKTNNMIKTPEFEDRLGKLLLKTKNNISSRVDR